MEHRLQILTNHFIPEEMSHATSLTTHETKGMSGHRVVHTDKAPAAIGPYSQALVHEKSGTVYVSGQLGMDPSTGQLVDTQDVEKQTVQALQNMNNILEAAGSHKSKVLKVNISLKSMHDFVKVNAIYDKFFEGHKPARACLEVARLPRDGLIEIESIAYL